MGLRPCFFALLLLLCFSGMAHGFIIINAPMTDTNASGWTLGGNPATARLTGTGNIAGGDDPVGSGWLRLTNNSGNQTGFASNSTTFDLSAGLLVQFDYATWGGNGADGYSVFLFDANVPTFNIGAFGGSLGYAQKLPPTVNPAVPGVSGGYVGIGVDEFGNFASPTEGRYLGPGQAANTMTVRGSVLGFGGGAVGQTDGTTSYPWIATSSNNGQLWYNGSPRPDQTSANYRKVIMNITPAPNPVLNAWIQFGYNTTPVQMITNLALPAISASQQLMVGFGASTGGSNNYHEIRNLLITTANENTSIDLGITKAASTASAIVGTPFQYTLTARNFGPNNITATGVGVVDTMPATLTPGTWSCAVVAGSPAGTGCGAASGSGNLNTTANLPKNGSVTYTLNATLNAMPAGNLLSNTASLTVPGAVVDFYSNDNSATSTINGYDRPTVTKSFTPASVPLNTNSALNITLTNPNNVAATGVGFTDTYPANLVNAAAAASPQCGGTITAASGGGSLVLAGGTIPANGSCTITANLKSATAGPYTNSIAAGAVTTTNIGSNSAAASAALTVLAPPTVTQSFSDGTIASGDNTNLTVTLGNPNAGAITLTGALTDTFPAGMTIGTAGNTGTCTGVTAAAGAGSFTVAGGSSIPAGGCTVVVNVTSTATGTNTIAAGALQTSAGSNAAAATATLTIYAAATLTKAYSAATIAAGAGSTLTFTVTNGTGRPAQSGMGFTDSFPAGLTVTAVSPVSGNGCGGTTSFTPSGVTLASGTITGVLSTTNGPCTFTATVQGNAAGSYVNNSAQFSGQTGGIKTGATTATLNVYAPPTVTKSFSPTSITLGGTSVLTLTLANPAANPGALTTVKVGDNFPAGLTLKNTTFTFTPAACGTVTKIAGTASAAGDNNVLLADTTQPAGASCQVQMNLTSSVANNFINTTNAPTAAGPIALTGATATASLNGTQAPAVTEAFAVGSLASGANTSLTLTISNTNASAIALTSSFIETLPAGMTIGSAGNTGTCGGVTASAGAGSFTMANGTSIPSGGCTVIVNVTSSTAGAAVDTVAAGDLQTTTGNNSAAASATLNVYAPPTVTKTFTPAGISYGGSSTMTITVTNPSANPGNLTGVSIGDNYVGTLLNNATGSVVCSGAGSATRTGGANGGASVGFNAGVIVPGGTCTITQSVTATATLNNSTTAPAATGPAALTGTAAGPVALTVTPVTPTVAEAFAVGSLVSGGNTSLTVTIGNTNAGAITLTATFTENLPAGMTIGSAGTTGTCGGVTAGAGAGNFTMANGSSIPAGGCTVIVNVTSSTAGAAADTIAAGDLQTVAGSNASPTGATLNVYAPPTLTKVFTPASIVTGDSSTLTITVTNPAANPGTLTGVSIGDSYTGTLSNSAAGSVLCSGAGSATLTGGGNGGTSVGFNTGSIAPGATCTITQSVTATSTNANTTGLPAASGPVALSGTAASATLTTTLLPAPTVVKTFTPNQEVVNGTTVLSVTLSNASAEAINGVAFTDTFPTSPGQMTVAGGASLSNSCGGTATIAANKLSFSLTGGTIPAGGSCALSVGVSAPTIGSYTNTTTTVTSSNAVTAAAASAGLTVAPMAAPTALMTFVSNQVGMNVNSLLTITLSNPNSVAINAAAFSTSYPLGLVNTGTANTTCTGGTATATNGATSTLALSNAAIPGSGSCTVTVNVASASAGGYLTSTGAISTGNAGTGSSVSATLNVLLPPTVTVAFNQSMIMVNGTSTLTFTFSNPNPIIAITGALFSDSYPSGLSNASPASGSTNCTSGGVTAANGGNTLALTGGATIPGGGSCTVTVNVTSSSAGSYPNSTGSLSVTTGNAGSGSAAPATLIVSGAPVLSVVKTVSPVSGAPGQLITYTAVVTNPSAGYAKNVVLTDFLSPYSVWGVNSYGAGVSFNFSDGGTPSGLTPGTPSYSKDGGATWSYLPSSGAGGAPANYDGYVTNWQIPMNGVMNPSGASFTLTYKVLLK